jgi:magnesium-protoporphyrin IX monomethyl ester (oxidative) cyclase
MPDARHPDPEFHCHESHAMNAPHAATLEYDALANLIDTVETADDAMAKATRSTMLTPRFYTTDFDAMDRMDVSPVRAEWDAMILEYEGDNNHDHFQRDATFAEEARVGLASMSPELRQEFLDFLISSCTSEFSGCILYNEIQKRVTNPDIKALMRYMARDESRHAGFINSALKDLGLGIDLGGLKKNKAYTFFKPKYILYATYLSEKIGYARYITIFRQLEKNPDKRFHPIFRWFERWCNDEFRHGESFALLMRAQPQLLSGVNKLWIRFFTLAVYATMYVRDHMRPLMHEAMGLHSTEYDYEVFRITSEIAAQVFPVDLDIDHPVFRAGMIHLLECAVGHANAKARGGVLGLLGQARHALGAAWTFGRLFFLPVKHRPLPDQIRVQPVW